MQARQCQCCGGVFRPRAQDPTPSYCSEASCQRARKRRWQRRKRCEDADYRANERAAQRRWVESHPRGTGGVASTTPGAAVAAQRGAHWCLKKGTRHREQPLCDQRCSEWMRGAGGASKESSRRVADALSRSKQVAQ